MHSHIVALINDGFIWASHKKHWFLSFHVMAHSICKSSMLIWFDFAVNSAKSGMLVGEVINNKSKYIVHANFLGKFDGFPETQ